MSSLRLALKQSLQEAGPAGKQKQSRSSRNRDRDDGSMKRRKRKQGESPRKRGRPAKGSRQRNDSDDDHDDRDHDDENYGGNSSSDENEFSAGEEEEEDEDDEEEESDTQSHNDDDDQPHKTSSGSYHHHNHNNRSQLQKEEDSTRSSPRPQHTNTSEHEADEDSDQERRRQHRKLQKKLKHSAAEKIQSQWKKKNNNSDDCSNVDEDESESRPLKSSSALESSTAAAADEAKVNSNKKSDGDGQSDEGAPHKKKKKNKGNNERGSLKGKTAKTVPPPSSEVLEWNRALPVKRARKNVGPGLRVKVRFATKVKRDGKIVRKKKWFGGRVSAVSKEGSKIRIKYDDGTAEISKFPDKDVVVDDAFNGEHQATANKFQPPELPEHVEEEANEESIQADQKRQPEPSPKPAVGDRKESPVNNSIVIEPEREEKPTTKSKSPRVSPRASPKAIPKSSLMTSPTTSPKEGKKTKQPALEVDIPSPPVVFKTQVVAPPSVATALPVATASPTIITDPVASAPAPPVATASNPPSPSEITPVLQSSIPTSKAEAVSENKIQVEESRAAQHVELDAPEPIHIRMASSESASASPGSLKASAPTRGKTAGSPDEKKTKDKKCASAKECSESEKEEENSVKAAPAPLPAAATIPQSPPTPDPVEEKEEPRHVDKPPPTRPTLTIRIPNLKKERRGSGTDGRSPRIKVSTRPVVHDSSDDDDDEAQHLQKASLSAPSSSSVADRKSTQQHEEKERVVVAGSKKRRIVDEAGPNQRDIEPVAPSSKRIHIVRPAVVSEDSVPTAASTPQPSEAEILKAKAQRPSSRHSNDGKPVVVALPDADVAVGGVADDANDGPVKIVGRVSAKRVPLFSDEEDDANSDNPKPKIVKSKQDSEKLHSAAMGGKDIVEIETQRPLPTKVATSESASIAQTGTSDAFKRDKDKLLVCSENSAFERKNSISGKVEGSEEELSETQNKLETTASLQAVAGADETKVARPSTPRDQASSASSTSVVRSGRRAAQQANERIVSTKQDGDKEKEKEKDSRVTAGRKRKKRDKTDEDSESSNEDDNNWVQCDRCKKWRIIPNHIKISSLPERWYCHLNVYDPKRNNCDAPEQTARTPVIKKKKRGRKKMRRASESLEASSNNEDLQALRRHDSSQSDATKEKIHVRARSPASKEDSKAKDAPPTANSTTPKPPRASPNSISVASAESCSVPEADGEPQTTLKKSKLEKKTKRLPDVPLESIPEVALAEVKVKRGRGGRSRKESGKDQEPDQEKGSVQGSASSQPAEQDAENVEWVQCEKCDKWRKLPPHISADELPDVWYCTMNTWNPGSASCDAPEDKADGQKDIEVFGASSSASGSGKLSFRNLIFGSGRKVNRPISERTRAAESIFATPSDDSDCTYPTVMYSTSSAFAPRGSRANIIEEDSHGFSVFDLMHHSRLFAELRGSSQPFNPSAVESAGFGKPFLSKYSFETLPVNMKQDMKDMILKAVGSNTLLGEEVLLECQCRQWDNAPPSWAQVRAYCTKDIVITLLCELVTEGKVQLVQAFGTDWTVKDWNPRYRLARDATNENAFPAPPKSRCMKIAKPWKQNAL